MNNKENNLREFKCMRCGNCCKGAGLVKVTSDDIYKISKFLDMSLKNFREKYTFKLFDEIYLLDKPDNDDCIFLFQEPETNLYGCTIQEAKPIQCQGYPYEWRNRDFREKCEGIKQP